jgi:5-methylcytosine-specific restriction endonuclease McrA
MEKNKVILLNADFSLVGLITWRKAVKLISKKRVEVIKNSDNILHNFEKTFSLAIPLVIRLLKLVREIFGKRVPYSKRNVFTRDDFICQYCGNKVSTNASVDHIKPRSLGGKSEWTNTTTACLKCNNMKDSRTCEQAKMYPKNKAYQPTINEFILKSVKHLGIDDMLKELGIC